MWRGGLLESEYLSAFMFPKFRLETAGPRFMRELKNWTCSKRYFLAIFLSFPHSQYEIMNRLEDPS